MRKLISNASWLRIELPLKPKPPGIITEMTGETEIETETGIVTRIVTEIGIVTAEGDQEVETKSDQDPGTESTGQDLEIETGGEAAHQKSAKLVDASLTSIGIFHHQDLNT